MNLTQTAAAALAGISLATWRRWEDDPDAVAPKTRTRCTVVLDKEAVREDDRRRRASEVAHQYEHRWGDSYALTPRQAYALVCALHWWADVDIDQWLKEPSTPLHEVEPFNYFDRRVMIHVNDNRAWAAKAQERCIEVGNEIESGTLPFDRAGCYFDELLMGPALARAQEMLQDMPELFDEIPAHSGDDETVGDDDWDLVSDRFDDASRWDEWEIPLHKDSPILPAILADNHPYSWFDLKPSSGPGYINRLVGLEGDPNNPQDKARMHAAAAALEKMFGPAIRPADTAD